VSANYGNLTPAQESLHEAYIDEDRPLVMVRGGRVVSAVVSVVFSDGGVWWMSDGCMDPMPSSFPDHFVEGEVTGTGPWKIGGDHVIVSPARGEPAMRAWETFVRLCEGNMTRHRARAEEILWHRETQKRGGA